MKDCVRQHLKTPFGLGFGPSASFSRPNSCVRLDSVVVIASRLSNDKTMNVLMQRSPAPSMSRRKSGLLSDHPRGFTQLQEVCVLSEINSSKRSQLRQRITGLSISQRPSPSSGVGYSRGNTLSVEHSGIAVGFKPGHIGGGQQ